MASKKWLVKVKDSNNKAIAHLTGARDISVTLKLSGTPSASFKLDIDDEKATDAILSTGVNDIEIFRDKIKIFRGRIWNRAKSYERDEGDVKIDALGHFALLDKRLAGKDGPREFEDTDAGTIAWTLIDESQSETGGDLDITQGTIQTSVARTRSYRYKRISEAIAELADAETGFDFEITPELVFNVRYPYQGTTNDNIVFRYPGAIERVEQIDQSGEIINYRVGLGKALGETEIRTKDSDASSILTYGRREDVGNYRDVDNVTTLGNMIAGDIARFKDLVAIYRIAVNQDSSGFGWGDWGIGDSVRFVVDTEKWSMDKTLRILGVEFRVDDEGRETVIFITGEVGASGVAGGASRPTEIPSIPSEIAMIEDRVEKLELNPPRGGVSVLVAPSADDGDFTDTQKAIDYVDGLGGGTVLIKAGTYNITTDLTLYSNISLIGEGRGSTILDFENASLTSAGIVAMGVISNPTGSCTATYNSTTISGTGTNFSSTVDVGNYIRLGVSWQKVAAVVSNTELTLEKVYRGKTITETDIDVYDPKVNIKVSSMSLVNLKHHGIDATVSINMEMENLYIRRFNTTYGYAGFQAYDTLNARISNCEVEAKNGIALLGDTTGGVISGVVATNCDVGISANGRFLQIIGNTLTNCQSGIGASAPAQDIVIKGNIIEDCSFDGIDLSEFNGGIISGNIINNSGDNGIEIDPTPAQRRVIISGNLVSNSGGWGIAILGAPTNSRLIINGNTFEDNTSGELSIAGTGVVISNNSIFPLATKVGIALGVDADSCIVDGNKIDGQSRATTTGISAAAGATNNILSDNSIIGVATIISDSGTGTIRRGNSDGIPSPSFSAYTDDADALTSGAFTKIQFDTETHDYGGVFDPVTNFRFTAPIAGGYNLKSQVSVTGLDDGKLVIISLYKNGSELRRGSRLVSPSLDAILGPTFAETVICAAGDYFEIYVYHDSGAGVTTESGIGVKCNWFTGEFVG